MKRLILTLSKTNAATLRDAFLVLMGIGIILLAVQLGYYFHLIKAYSWQ